MDIHIFKYLKQLSTLYNTKMYEFLKYIDFFKIYKYFLQIKILNICKELMALKYINICKKY